MDDTKDLKTNPIPNYYIGNTYGYEARKVVEDWDLSYNVGTAGTLFGTECVEAVLFTASNPSLHSTIDCTTSRGLYPSVVLIAAIKSEPDSLIAFEL